MATPRCASWPWPGSRSGCTAGRRRSRRAATAGRCVLPLMTAQETALVRLPRTPSSSRFRRHRPSGCCRSMRWISPAGWSSRLGSTPIVNVHAVFDRTVMDEAFLACVGSPLQWLFDRSAPAGLRTGQYLAASLSAADEVAAQPVGEIRSRLLPELERVLPRVRGATLLDFFVTREPHATFRQAPGSGRWRPGTTTRLPGLVLAGAHTATGWPATMEGAVRSGNDAADAVLDSARRRTGAGVAA